MLADARRAVATEAASLARLTPGRTGNLSVREAEKVAITPSGRAYETLEPADVPIVSLDGAQLTGSWEPSTETPLHRRVYRSFDAGAVVHVHSPWATTLAVLREPLPPIHYLLATVGTRVPLADYATFGTEALADNAVSAMDGADSDACLLANHGLVVKAEDATSAIDAARTVESLARLYCQARAVGRPVELPAEELERTARKLADYGPDRDASGED